MLVARFFFLLLCPVACISCGTETPKSPNPKPLTEAEKKAKIEQLKLNFNSPVLIDSSVYVMYPLVLNSTTEEGESDYGSKYRNKTETYWNIVFYNTATGASHLLDSSRKMVIYSFNPSEPGNSTATFSDAEFIKSQKSGYRQVDKLLYYSIRTNDFNRDGVIDEKDPNYLFASDRAGTHFKQISPDNYHVSDWQKISGTNKILLQTVAATTNNQVFGENDVTVPMVYDLSTDGPAKAIFSPAFTTSAKKLLDAQWLKSRE